MVDIVTMAMAKAGSKTYTDDAIDRALTSVYKYKGQCTNAQLSSKTKKQGDVWEITDDGTFAAGTDVVYNGTSWAAMAGQIHVTVVDSLTSTSTTDALSAAMGKSLQDNKQANLVSGTNIKTINSATILGAGDIQLQTPLTSGVDYQPPLPSMTGNAGKVLKVNSAGTDVEWATDLHAEFYLDVTVTASAGTPALDGVTVTATPTSGQIIQGVTDAQGKCRLTVAQGVTYTITGAKAGYYVSSTSATISSLITTAVLTCYVLPTVTITQTGATGVITCSPTAVSQVDNSFTLLPDTSYTFSVSDVTGYFTPTSQTVSYNAGTTNSIAFTYTAKPILTVTVTGEGAENLVVSATNGTDTVTGATDTNGVAVMTLNGTGTYTVSVPSPPSGSTVDPQTVSASAGGTPSCTLTIVYAPAGYGYAAVDISISESDPASRCTYPQTITVNGATVDNSCYGFTPMAGSSGGIFTTGSWTSHGILDGIKPVSSDGGSTPTFTDADKDASTWTSGTEYFTEFPFNWLSITNDGSKIRIIFSDSDTQPDSTFQCYAHAKACDSYSNTDIEGAVSSVSRNSIMSSNNNSYFANAFHIGCFGGNVTSSNLYSKCSNTYTRSVAYANFWKYANARGGEYDCMSFQQWTYLQALFILLFKSTNSQGAHSQGLAKVGSETLSGIDTNAPLSTDNLGMAGKIGTAERMSFFWIHDLWGNYYQFIGGIWNRAQSSVYMLYYWLPRQANSRAFNNGWNAAIGSATQTDMGTDTGLTYSSSVNFIKTTAGTNTGGFAPIRTSGGSATTYWCDHGRVSADSSRAYFPRVGGIYSDSTGIVGIFYCSVGYYSADSGASYGSRLSYRGGH